MRQKVFLPALIEKERSRGFSLVELLVTLLISSIMMAVMVGFVRTAVATRQTGGAVTEAGQGLRAVVGLVTQELRQAGACLPPTNRALALQGANNGTRDSLTLRIGRVDPSTTLCVNPTVVTTQLPLAPLPNPAVGNTVLNVPNGMLFRLGESVWVTTTGAAGAFYKVTGRSGTTITLDHGLENLGVGAPYGVSTQVFAIEERGYAVDISNPARPMLTVAIDQGSPQPFVSDIDIFDVQYWIGPCSAPGVCTSLVDLPSAAQWQNVAKIALSARVRSRMKDKYGNYQYVSTGRGGQDGDYINIQPRNFIANID